MRMRRSFGMWLSAAWLAAGVASAATFDRGLVPKETPSSGTTAGQQFSGDTSVVFGSYDPGTGTATGYDAVVRLRKGNETHVFYTSYSCAADPCGLCLGGQMEVDTNQVAIQMCIEDAVEPEVIADFKLNPSLAVRLKEVSDPAAKFYPPSLLVFGAQVEVTAK